MSNIFNDCFVNIVESTIEPKLKAVNIVLPIWLMNAVSEFDKTEFKVEENHLLTVINPLP